MDGYVVIGTEIDTKGFDKEIAVLEDKLNDIKATLQMADEDKTLFSTSEIKDMEAEAQKLGRKIDNLKEKQIELDTQGLPNTKKIVSDIGNSTEGIIKKVARWGLAIFGIRSAYMLIRQSMNVLAENNKKMSADIQNIRSALASALEPIIKNIIQLVYTLLQYLGYIIKAWTGKNIFENTNKGLKKATGQAKKLQKTLQSFDEMNITQDTSSGGEGSVSPSVDLSKIPDKVPGWVDFLAKNGKTLIGILGGISAGMIAIKLGAEGIVGLGIGAIVTGVIMLIQDLIEVFNDPSWQNIVSILGDIAVAIGGIMLITGNWWGLLVSIVGLLVKLVVDNWETIAGVLGEVGTWINDNVIKPVATFFSTLWNNIKTGVVETWNKIVGVVSGVASWIYDKIIEPVGNFFGDMWNGFKDGASKAWEGVKTVFSTVADFFKKIFTSAWTAVKNVFSTGGKIFDGIKDGIVDAFKAIVNAIITGINKVVAIPFNAINSVLRKLKSINILGIEPFGWVKEFSVPQIPKLAKGGIINQPGRGVAIGGEAGQEGVIPLTDIQQMQRLGEAIGKYITVNAQMNNYMNGRLISRELQQIQNDENFAFNGG